MIEITKPEEVNAIKNVKIRDYLYRRLNEVGYKLNPKSEGSFLYVDDPEQFHHKHQLHGTTLPSIEQGLFSSVEAITVELGIIEISLLFNNEYLLSIVIDEKHCSDKFLQQINLELQ